MASGAYTSGIKDWMDANQFLTGTFKWLLVSTATPYTYNVDDDFVDAGGANDVVDAETNVSGYIRGWGGAGRLTVASKTFTVNDTNNRLELDCADPSWAGLGTGETLAAALIIREGAANDTTSQLYAYLDFNDVASGGTLTLQVASNGIVNFLC